MTYRMTQYLALEEYKLWVFSLQGEKGDAGLPGPTGAQGIPVSL